MKPSPQKSPRLSRLERSAETFARSWAVPEDREAFDLMVKDVMKLARRYAARKLREASEIFFCGHAFDQRETCTYCEYRHTILALSKSTTPRRDGGRGRGK